MSALRVVLLLLLNLALYAFLLARLLGWRPPGWRAETMRQRVLSIGIAVTLTVSVLLGGMTLITSGMVTESDSVSILRSALWIDAAIILLLLVLWGLPQLPWWELRSESIRQRAVSAALALALTITAGLVGIALVASGTVSRAGSDRLLRIMLSVDAAMVLMLVVLWVFPRLPWPVYAGRMVQARPAWLQAIGGLATAVLIVATVVGGFTLAYGEIGALDRPNGVQKSLPTTSTLAVAVVGTDILPTLISSPTEYAPIETAIAMPTRSGTEIPTATATSGSVSANTITRVHSPTATAQPLPTATVAPTATRLPEVTAVFTPTATMVPKATIVPTPTPCVSAAIGWVEYTVQYGDTLSELARRVGTPIGTVLQVNCLSSHNLNVGQRILLPQLEVLPEGVLLATWKDSPPVIDGDLSEWGVLANSAEVVVYGASNWSGSSDLSATFSLGWDTTNLYLAVSVRDDVYSQTQYGESIFRGDSVELLLDVALQSDRQHPKLSADDYQIGLSAGDLNGSKVAGQAYLWFPIDRAGALSDAQIVGTATVDGYVLEAAVPWVFIGVTPARLAYYGFALSVSDNDLYGQASQQSMVSSAAGRMLNNPTTWGQLRLDQ